MRREWRHLRVVALERDNYLCQLRISSNCTRFATTVHHIKPVDQFPDLALDLDNLTSCCFNCHEQTKPHVKGNSPQPPEGVRVIRIL